MLRTSARIAALKGRFRQRVYKVANSRTCLSLSYSCKANSHEAPDDADFD